MWRDQLLPALAAGKGDIVSANLTSTPERQTEVQGVVPNRIMNRSGAGWLRLLCAAALPGVLGAGCSTTAELPGALSSPDHGVVCDSRRGVCFDRFGPSIGLTGAFLGAGAAQALTAALRETPPARGPVAEFSPGDKIACQRETGPCRTGDAVHTALTTVLYGPRLAGWHGAEASAAVGVDWRWNASRYNNDTESRPADPGRYRLRLEPDGSLRARADCNQAGGRYRIEGSIIAVELTHSTMAACEPESLDQTFRRELGAAAIYSMRSGKLYLKHDTGTMEFARQ